MKKTRLSGLQKIIIFVIMFCCIIIIGIKTGDQFYITIPAVYPIGSVILGYWVVMKIASHLFMRCHNCKGYGSVNLKIWQKIINFVITGWLGEKCPICKGKGITRREND